MQTVQREDGQVLRVPHGVRAFQRHVQHAQGQAQVGRRAVVHHGHVGAAATAAVSNNHTYVRNSVITSTDYSVGFCGRFLYSIM